MLILDDGSRNNVQNSGNSFYTDRADHPTEFQLKNCGNYLHLCRCLQKFNTEVDG
jgi:hypothetical protein